MDKLNANHVEVMTLMMVILFTLGSRLPEAKPDTSDFFPAAIKVSRNWIEPCLNHLKPVLLSWMLLIL